MENVNITELRANLLKYLKKAQSGEQILITSGGQVLATLVAPIDLRRSSKRKLKQLSKAAILRDVISPTEETWNAAQ